VVRRHRALYAAFDRFPSRKGAAVHIDRFARTLFDSTGGGLLYVLGGGDLPAWQIEGNVEIVRFCAAIDNFLERTIAFSERLDTLLDEIADSLLIAHFRDPWSGLPVVSRPHSYATVYEVNALPTIELPYAYPTVAPGTLEKIERLEQIALEKADVIVTPAAAIRDHLVKRQVPRAKISVIPNGADLPDAAARPADAPARYILYFGALQEWHETRYGKAYLKLSEQLEIADRVIWRCALPAAELQPWLQHALASVAPLTDCARNVVQGCSPLKIIESMAAGVPVIASDLPAVREMVTDRVEGLLVPPDRPAALARAIRILFEYPELRRSLGARGRERVERSFTWANATRHLHGVYEAISPAQVRA
jgi:glycosyltransferase involved in cell wall biosynthesis